MATSSAEYAASLLHGLQSLDVSTSSQTDVRDILQSALLLMPPSPSELEPRAPRACQGRSANRPLPDPDAQSQPAAGHDSAAPASGARKDRASLMRAAKLNKAQARKQADFATVVASRIEQFNRERAMRLSDTISTAWLDQARGLKRKRRSNPASSAAPSDSQRELESQTDSQAQELHPVAQVDCPSHHVLVSNSDAVTTDAISHLPRRKHELTLAAQLRLTWPGGQGSYGSIGTTASLLGIMKGTVSYVRKGVAQALVHSQQLAVDQWLSELKPRSTACFIDKLKWDETKQLVSMPKMEIQDADNVFGIRRPPPRIDAPDQPANDSNDDDDNVDRSGDDEAQVAIADCAAAAAVRRRRTKRRRMRGAAESILVQLRTCVAVPARRDDGLTKIMLATPARVLRDKGGLTTFAGLQAHGVPLDVVARCVPMIVLVRECDAAKANEVCLRREANSMPDCAVLLHVFCWAHQMHIISATVVAATSNIAPRAGSRGKLAFLASLFSASMLLRTPGYFVSMMMQVQRVVSQSLVVLTAHTPDMLRRHTEILQACGIDAGRPAWAELLACLCGDWHDDSCIQVYWSEDKGAAHRADIAHYISELLCDTVFASLPDVPAPARWARIGYCLTWWSSGMVIHNVLSKVLLLAFDPSCTLSCMLPEHIRKLVRDPVDATIADEPELDSTAYAATIGRRCNALLAFTKSPSSAHVITCTAAILSALQYPYHALLHMSAQRAKRSFSSSRPAPLLDFLWPRASPLVVVQQFFARTLLRRPSEGPLYITAASVSVRRLVACLAFRLLMIGAAGLYVRLEWLLQRWPLRLFMCCDERQALSDRRRTAICFQVTRPCCMGEFDTARLWRAIEADARGTGCSMADALMGADWQQVLRAVAMEIDMNTADVENAHAFAKRAAGACGSSAELMSAMALLRQGRSISEAMTRSVAGSRPSPSAPEPERDARAAKFQSWTALHFLHSMRARERLSEKTAFMSKDAWADTRAAFEAMTDDERIALVGIASAPGASALTLLAASSIDHELTGCSQHTSADDTHSADMLIPSPFPGSDLCARALLSIEVDS